MRLIHQSVKKGEKSPVKYVNNRRLKGRRLANVCGHFWWRFAEEVSAIYVCFITLTSLVHQKSAQSFAKRKSRYFAVGLMKKR